MSKVNGNDPNFVNVYGDFCVGGNGLTARGENLLYTGEDIGDVSAFDYKGSDVSYGSIMKMDTSNSGTNWYDTPMNIQTLNQTVTGTNPYTISLSGSNTQKTNNNTTAGNSASVYSIGPYSGNGTNNDFKIELHKDCSVIPSDESGQSTDNNTAQTGGGKYSYSFTKNQNGKWCVSYTSPDGKNADVTIVQKYDIETYNKAQKELNSRNASS